MADINLQLVIGAAIGGLSVLLAIITLVKLLTLCRRSPRLATIEPGSDGSVQMETTIEERMDTPSLIGSINIVDGWTERVNGNAMSVAYQQSDGKCMDEMVGGEFEPLKDCHQLPYTVQYQSISWAESSDGQLVLYGNCNDPPTIVLSNVMRL